MLKEDVKTDLDFGEILDRARDLNRELVRSRGETREVKIEVIDDPDATDDGSGVVAKCAVTIVADTLKEAKYAKAHLEGAGHNCKCARNKTTVTCLCP